MSETVGAEERDERSGGEAARRRDGAEPAAVEGDGTVRGEPAARGDGSAGEEPRQGVGGIDGITRFIGMRWEDPRTVRLAIRPELINRGGMLSGVVTYALVDYCMGSTLWVETAQNEHIATVNIAINYVQTAREGEIVCRSTLDRRNRSNAVMSSEVRHEDGRLLVTAIGSYAIFIPRHLRSADGAAHANADADVDGERAAAG